MSDKRPRSAPVRQPLILTFDELQWICFKVSERHADLIRYYQRGRKGQRKLHAAIRLLDGLREKLWRI
jgi:hypothetical protein